jgi:hypothetical protein
MVQGLIIGSSRSHSVTHTTLGRTPLDGWSARRRDLYLTTLIRDRGPCPGWIRIRISSKRAVADPLLRPRGHQDRKWYSYGWKYEFVEAVWQLPLNDVRPKLKSSSVVCELADFQILWLSQEGRFHWVREIQSSALESKNSSWRGQVEGHPHSFASQQNVSKIRSYWEHRDYNLYRCTVHLDINVLRSPTDALIY